MPRHPPPLHLALNTTSIYVVNETTPNAADLVYARVKQRILQGDLEGGRMLSEGELAAEHGVSRTPVREAFLRLQAEGWMRLYPKRGALVVESTPGEIAQVLEARRLLENYAVQRLSLIHI